MKAKKSLGQNFLKSKLALKKIIEAGNLTDKDTVLEIGPGKGALTEELLNTKVKVIAVEKDYDLLEILNKKFEKQIVSGQLRLINEDILEFDIDKYLQKYKILANIPYNITGAILKKFLTSVKQPELMVLMVQKEVAKRIVANNKKDGESILSISVKAYGAPKIITKVPARYFSPAPKVDSAVISINNISRELFIKNEVEEEKFWQIVKAGFAHKRKKLSSNLKNIKINCPKELGDKRAEDLSIEDWMGLLKTSL